MKRLSKSMKLTLSKESLRVLGSAALEFVAGAGVTDTGGANSAGRLLCEGGTDVCTVFPPPTRRCLVQVSIPPECPSDAC